MKLLVAVGGASGSLYARRLLDTLAAAPGVEVATCFSPCGLQVWRHELGGEPNFPFHRYAVDDFASPFASGSALWDAVVVIPCSMGRLARIAHGMGDDLISRAADVALKERRKLVLVVRETPLSQIHLENMLAVTRAGAVVLPAAPSFYFRPATIEALADTVVARVLDQLSVVHSLAPRWAEEEVRR
ncbi:MAG: UbiX family flavin prenyltransferase [Polyangia bacterium]|jgi:4-hydroxy-3-polyprenylbenzoate decarboxylase